MRFSNAAAVLAALLLAGCVSQRATVPEVPEPPVAPTVAVAPRPVIQRAAEAALAVAPPQSIDEAGAQRALAAFRLSCPVLITRDDVSGLTRIADWMPLCTEATTIAPGAAATFFHDRFAWLQVGDGKSFATGYYEPEIRASRVRAPGFDVPVYALPADLVRCTRADGSVGRGMIDPAGACVAYPDRAAIEDGALAGKGLEIAWAADPVELFFLEVQGSGRLALPDGSVMRIGYAGQNGRDYVAICKLLRDRGELPAGGATMQSIIDWIHAHPEDGKALLRSNPSYVFFRELTGPGPVGTLGVAVTPHATVAADARFIPLGAPVYLAVDRPEASGLWVAQDSGGAIRGANRVDTFWGAGPEARTIAGGMSASGRAWVLVPRGTPFEALTGAQARP